MRVALGIPAQPRPGEPDHVLVWAARAEAGPFSSLVAGDRVVSRGNEALAVLAAAAGATSRVRLLAALVVGPIRETSLLARQAASIDAISGGRLTLGLGVGARTDDYAATGTPFATRGQASEAQLVRLRRIWSGEPADDGGPVPIGPVPVREGGPELLLGGYVPAIADRIAAHADGFLAPGGADPVLLGARWRDVQVAWGAAGRAGEPRLVVGSYYALGPAAAAAADAYIDAYYGYDPAVAARRRATLPTTPEAIAATVRRAEDLGADELILRPVEADLQLVDRLAELVRG